MTGFNLSCPSPFEKPEQILLAHGGGGRLMQRMIQQSIYPAFDNKLLRQNHDGAVFEIEGSQMVLTTDAYVVQPLFFAGGDIGKLAVYGTVNDLAMCGARPLYLSVALILEEGLDYACLDRVLKSMREAADHSGVALITGDTKVVEKGKGDGLYITTSGVGVKNHEIEISPRHIQPGDQILINGSVGQHGMAIMAEREGLAFEGDLQSDCAPLNTLVQQLLDAGLEIHCLRDPTRGGVASALNEIAQVAQLQITLQENAVPVQAEVAGACEILGFDPLYVANEGKMLIFLPVAQAEQALTILREHPLGQEATQIGQVQTGLPQVLACNPYGSQRVLDLLSGEQLPRIC